MNWEFVSAKDNFENYSNDWDKLNARYFGNHPYFASQFVGPLISHFADSDHLLAIGRENGLINRMLVLERRSAVAWTIFKPSQAQMGLLLMPDLEGLHSLFDMLPGVALSLDFLCQDPIYSPFHPERRKSSELWQRYVETMGISVRSSFEDYWSSRSRNLRKSIARRINKYEVEPRLVVHSEDEQIQEALYRYGIMESRGWKGKDGTAVHPDNIQGKFYGQALEKFAELRGAFIFELYIEDDMAASQIAIGNGSMLVMLKTTFDESLAHLAPGRVLQYMLLDHEFSSRRHEVLEYYTNATNEQKSWATHTRQIYHVGVARNTLLQAVFGIARRSRRLARSVIHYVNRNGLEASSKGGRPRKSA